MLPRSTRLEIPLLKNSTTKKELSFDAKFSLSPLQKKKETVPAQIKIGRDCLRDARCDVTRAERSRREKKEREREKKRGGEESRKENAWKEEEKTGAPDLATDPSPMDPGRGRRSARVAVHPRAPAS